MPDRLAFAIKVADSFDIPSEDSLSQKLAIPGVVGFLLLLGDEIHCLGLVTDLGLWANTRGFESRALVTDGTRTGFVMPVLSKLTWIDLSELCARLYLLEKVGEKHILFYESNKFEKHPCLCCMDAVSNMNKLELDGKLWKQKGLCLGSTKICKGFETPLDLISIRLNPSQFATACRPPF